MPSNGPLDAVWLEHMTTSTPIANDLIVALRAHAAADGSGIDLEGWLYALTEAVVAIDVELGKLRSSNIIQP